MMPDELNDADRAVIAEAEAIVSQGHNDLTRWPWRSFLCLTALVSVPACAMGVMLMVAPFDPVIKIVLVLGWAAVMGLVLCEAAYVHLRRRPPILMGGFVLRSVRGWLTALAEATEARRWRRATLRRRGR